MESNRTLSSAIFGLQDISNTDLNIILKVESPPLSSPHHSFCESTQNDFEINRETMPSQVDLDTQHEINTQFDYQSVNSDFPMSQLITHNDISSSIISSSDLEHISLTFSQTELPQSEIITDMEIAARSPYNSSVFVKEEEQDNNCSFFQEFLNNDNDFDLSHIELDESQYSIQLDSHNQNQDNLPIDLSNESTREVDTTLIEEFCKIPEDFEVPSIDHDDKENQSTSAEHLKSPQNISSAIEPHSIYRKYSINQHKRPATTFSYNNTVKNGNGRLIMTCPAEMARPGSNTTTYVSSEGDSAPNPMLFLSLEYTNKSQTTKNMDNASIACDMVADLTSSNLLNRSADGVDTSKPIDYSIISHPIGMDSSSPIAELNFNIGKIYSIDISLIPSSVKQLYDTIRTTYSDFAFVYALSAQMCQDRVPMDCFTNYKMGLLLSLASLGPDPDRPPIPVIAIGSDTAMAHYLMTKVGDLADRFIGPTDDIKLPSAKSAKYVWIEADPILLAKGGVYYIGDWTRLKAARSEKIFKDLESGRVALERTTLTCPLKTAVWSHWKSYKNNAKDQQTFNKFVKIFGIPITVDDDNHEVLVNYILEQSSVRIFESTIDHLSITPDEMREFLAVINKRTVDMSSDASIILQKYFVASRIDRPDCLSKQAFITLKQFAESFAKLSFRHEVLPIDAIAAIYMSENFIQNVFGASEYPPPKFTNHNFVGNVDEHMTKFQQWLRLYIERFYNQTEV